MVDVMWVAHFWKDKVIMIVSLSLRLKLVKRNRYTEEC